MDKRLYAPPFLSPDAKGDTFQYERFLIRSGYAGVAGVDEAGRGPLAGPVVAGCVVLPENCEYHLFKDSKKLTAARRDMLFELLHTCGAKIGFSIVEPDEIDQINILQASLQAMVRSVSHLAENSGSGPDYLLVDGKFTTPSELPQQAMIKGESKSASIAAASIIAKVTRDRLMAGYHEQFPQYDFARNKGYPTADHRRAIERHGPCPIHRRTFKGVRQFLDDAGKNPPASQPALWNKS